MKICFLFVERVFVVYISLWLIDKNVDFKFWYIIGKIIIVVVIIVLLREKIKLKLKVF